MPRLASSQTASNSAFEISSAAKSELSLICSSGGIGTSGIWWRQSGLASLYAFREPSRNFLTHRIDQRSASNSSDHSTGSSSGAPIQTQWNQLTGGPSSGGPGSKVASFTINFGCLGSHHEGSSARDIVQDLTIAIAATMLKRLPDAIRVEKAAMVEPHLGMTHRVITRRCGKRLLKMAFEVRELLGREAQTIPPSFALA